MKISIISLILLILVQTIFAQNISLELNKNWQFKNQKENKWYKATVPGTVHTDLLDNKLIPNPYYRDNESKLQWIDKADWEYKTVFNIDASAFSKKNIELVFDGLDTYADVYLNDQLILKADNMFRQWIVNVKSLLKKTNNELLIKFASAQNKVDSIAKTRLPLVLPDNNRVYVRKAQFQFGWDWGPIFVGCGIWKSIKLKGWDDFKINNVQIKIDFRKDTSVILSSINFTGIINPGYSKILTAERIIERRNKNITAKQVDTFALPFMNDEKWFQLNQDIKLYQAIKTNDYFFDETADKKTYYRISFKVKKGNAVLDSVSCKTEIKDTRLIQQPDRYGRSFYFARNNKPVYAKGANWIPADVFLPRLTKDDYRKLLFKAKEANMNMLRVWGGGVYEDDYFYDLCDSLGIMVWQDFMFAGGMYPGDESFFTNVREEIKYQIERLRNHSCIVLWCGNNEIDEAWKNWGWQNQFNLHGADSAKVWNDYKRLFEDSLRKWVDQFDGTRPYVSTSPKFGWGHKASLAFDDSHYWGVWWGLEDWEVFEKKTGRFISEYGMQAMPNTNTIENFTEPADRFLYSPVIQAHQKANDGFKKLNHYLNRYFIDSAKLNKLSLEDYTYLTQCLQYYILKNSIAVHRSKSPANMGTLLWQLNDCWPVASWSITDYSRQPKAAWYAVKEAYRDDVMPKRDSIYPKDLKLMKPDFKISVSGNTISIRSNVDAKYIYLSPGLMVNSFSDNYFDLKAGKTKQLTVTKTQLSRVISLLAGVNIKSLYDILNAQ
ncbi:MAG: glycoside hydrolase family 2 protein [Ferruginibacter sp.]